MREAYTKPRNTATAWRKRHCSSTHKNLPRAAYICIYVCVCVCVLYVSFYIPVAPGSYCRTAYSAGGAGGVISLPPSLHVGCFHFCVNEPKLRCSDAEFYLPITVIHKHNTVLVYSRTRHIILCNNITYNVLCILYIIYCWYASYPILLLLSSISIHQ